MNEAGEQRTPIGNSQVGIIGDHAIVHGGIHFHDSLAMPPLIPLQRPLRPAHFIGRKDELAQLSNQLCLGKVVTLCGLGGIGKTAIVAEAVWTLAPADVPPDSFPEGILFYSFNDQPYIASAATHLIRSLDPRSDDLTFIALRRLFANKRVLIILDAAEKADDLPTLLDCLGTCALLITTRQCSKALSGFIEIGTLTRSDSISVLQSWAGQRADDLQALSRIAGLVGNLPLALRLVGHYMCTHQQNAVEYLAWLETAPLDALHHGQHQHESITILMDKSVSSLSPSAREVLSVIGALAPIPFDAKWIVSALDRPDFEVNRLLGEIVDHGILLRPAENYVISHVLMYTYIRRTFVLDLEASLRLTDFFSTLVEKGFHHGSESLFILDPMRSHFIYFLETCVSRGYYNAALRFVKTVGVFFDLRGVYSERINLFELAIHAAHALSDHDAEAEFTKRLGSAHSDSHHNLEAISCYEKALAIGLEIHNRKIEGHCLSNLGTIEIMLGHPADAITYFERALVISRELCDFRAEAIQLGDLGIALSVLGRVSESISYYEQGLIIAREIGDRRIEGIHLINLGKALFSLGRVSEANSCYEQGLVITREIGDRRTEGRHLECLGQALSSLGRVSEAKSYYEQSLVIAREIGDRLAEGNLLGEFGKSLSYLGQAQEAIACFEQGLGIAREIRDRQLEEAFLVEIGQFLWSLGCISEAITYYEQVSNFLDNGANSTDSEKLAIILSTLALLYHEAGRMKEAACSMRRVLDLKPEDTKYLNNFGCFLYEIGEVDEALTIFSQALLLNPEDARVFYNRGLVYHDMGDFQSAIACYGRALDLNPGYIDAYNNRGRVYHTVGRYANALADYNCAVELDSECTVSLYNIACLNALLGRPADACVWLEKTVSLNSEYRTRARTDPEFASIRDEPCFQALIDED